MSSEKPWQGTTYGNSVMHRWLIALLRRTDVRLLYVFAYVFVVPPCLLRPTFKPVFRMFRQRMGYSVLRAFRATYRNHCMFAQAVIDKFAMYAGRRFNMDIEGLEHFQRLERQPEGFVLFSSHIGNYEIAGYTLNSSSKAFNALVYPGEKESVMNNRQRMFSHTNVRMIPVSEDMSHLFLLSDALSQGQIVSIPADRIWGSQKHLTTKFLGREARFPQGPFTLATLRRSAVLSIQVMKSSALSYHVIVTPLHYDPEAERSLQQQQLLEQYAATLENTLRRYPTQWYNYYNFW